jgi:ABC-type amino acid transport substrate-binding protein
MLLSLRKTAGPAAGDGPRRDRPAFVSATRRVHRLLLRWALVVAWVVAGCGLSWTGVAQAQERELVVGSEVDFPPFATGAADSTPGGFTVELWQAVAQEMQLKYRFKVRPFDELLQEFRAGRVDVLINLAQSAKRSEFSDFSVPNVVAYGAIFTRKAGPHPQTEQEAKERSILVLRGDLAHDYALANGYRNLVPVSDVASAMKLLAAGQHDGVLVSRLAGLMTLKELGLVGIAPIDEQIRGVVQRFSFAVRKGDSDLLARINEGLALAHASGRTQAIY